MENQNKITSVILESLDRPDYGSISFALYSAGPYILERMDGYSGISSINTFVKPYQRRNGSFVSDPNNIGGKNVSMLVNISGETESETLRIINRINGILRTKMRLTVTDDGKDFLIDNAALAESSYNLERISPTLYALEFMLASGSAYRLAAEISEKVISGGGDVIEGGIVYPTFTPDDDLVTYPDFTTAYTTITARQENYIVIDGNGEIYPILIIEGFFWDVKITHTNPTGEVRTVHLHSIGGINNPAYHKWIVDMETLELISETPNVTSDPDFDDPPIVISDEWFELNSGQNIIKAVFTDGINPVTGATVTAVWQEKYL